MLTRIREERKPTRVTRKRKASRLGHMLRRNCLKRRIIERNVGEKRRKAGTLEDIKNGRSCTHMKGDATDREKLRIFTVTCHMAVSLENMKKVEREYRSILTKYETFPIQ